MQMVFRASLTALNWYSTNILDLCLYIMTVIFLPVHVVCFVAYSNFCGENYYHLSIPMEGEAQQ